MNIVYLLTNKSKNTGPRFYIGSKTECAIIKLNQVDTIISLTTNRPYYSSSQSPDFKSDFLKGDLIEVSKECY